MLRFDNMQGIRSPYFYLGEKDMVGPIESLLVLAQNQSF